MCALPYVYVAGIYLEEEVGDDAIGYEDTFGREAKGIIALGELTSVEVFACGLYEFSLGALTEACRIVSEWDAPLCAKAREDVLVLELFVAEVLGLVVAPSLEECMGVVCE